MYEYQAHILNVVDGDTFDAIIDLGFNVNTKQRFRMLGINAPETRTKDLDEKQAGLLAKEELKQLIEGKSVLLLSKGKDKYGRWLATVQYNGLNINEQLLATGFAREYM